MPHSGKHGLVPPFLRCVDAMKLKSTYFSLKIIHFLSLNIWYVIYVVFWIKYWNLKLPHCILFLFTICTVSQLFWNRVCTWSVKKYTNTLQASIWETESVWIHIPVSTPPQTASVIYCRSVKSIHSWNWRHLFSSHSTYSFKGCTQCMKAF